LALAPTLFGVGNATPLPPRAFAERLLAHLPGLTKFVRKRMGPELRSHESASDIVQSTYRELLRGAARFEDQGEPSFENWVRKAAEHKLQNRARHWRAERRAGEGLDVREHEPASPPSSRPTQEARLREEAERLAHAFAALNSEERQVLVRSQIDGVSHATLALELGLSSEAVRKRVARALARLSTELEEPDSD
jgi:RNA polymerase sigma-70 factor (ECF subfamily)